jgi:hypothetical protein
VTGETRIIVEMTKEDAELFVKFRQFQHIIEKLNVEGIIGMKNGSVTLHYDRHGTIRTVQVVKNYVS